MESGNYVLRIEATGQSFRISCLQCLHSAANYDNNNNAYCLCLFYTFILHMNVFYGMHFWSSLCRLNVLSCPII